MDVNDYTMELYVKAVLQEARDAAARRALLDPAAPVVRPALRALLRRIRSLTRAPWAPRPAGARPLP